MNLIRSLVVLVFALTFCAVAQGQPKPPEEVILESPVEPLPETPASAVEAEAAAKEAAAKEAAEKDKAAKEAAAKEKAEKAAAEKAAKEAAEKEAAAKEAAVPAVEEVAPIEAPAYVEEGYGGGGYGEDAGYGGGESGYGYGGDEEEAEGPKFTLNGFVQNQTGLFIDWTNEDTTALDPREVRQYKDVKAHKYKGPFYTNHGDKLGEFSLMRWTLQLEGDYTPSDFATLHWVFRGVRSLQLDADAQAQPPNPAGIDDRSQWVADNFYTENDLRELYLDIEASDDVSFRVGRQQVPWGELGQYRLLDVINPIDATWHFASVENFEDVRIPLWIVKSLIEVRPLDGSLELVWVPMIDDPEDTVSVPLTFVGAWGLPIAPLQELDNTHLIGHKVFDYPENEITNSRAGARWKGTLGDFTYTLVYYYTHQLSPPVPSRAVNEYNEETGATDPGIVVHLDFPRQHILGLSLDATLDNPIGAVVRLEAAYEPDRTYPVYSTVPKLDPKDSDGNLVEFPTGSDTYQVFEREKKQVATYGLQVMRPTFIRFLNPEQTIMLVFQAMHTVILDYDEDDQIIDVPGFDSTLVKRNAFTFVFSAFTNYFHGLMTPKLLVVYIPGTKDDVTDEDLAACADAAQECTEEMNRYAYEGSNDSGLVSGSLGFTLGTSWRLTTGVNVFWGGDPYKGLGLFRDRDEVFTKLQYQF